MTTTQVRMLVSISGTRNGQDWPPRGELATLPADEAAAMTAAGLVELAADEQDGADVEVAADEQGGADVEVAADEQGGADVEVAADEQGGADVEVAADVAKPRARRGAPSGGAA